MKSEDRYDSLFRYTADSYGFTGKDWLRFKAQVKAESSFNPRAVSGVGARGLAQFMPATWGEWGKGGDPFNPEQSIEAQVRYMKWILQRLTNWDSSFAAYNWGIGNVTKLDCTQNWKMSLPLETRNYVFKINKYYEEYVRG